MAGMQLNKPAYWKFQKQVLRLSKEKEITGADWGVKTAIFLQGGVCLLLTNTLMDDPTGIKDCRTLFF